MATSTQLASAGTSTKYYITVAYHALVTGPPTHSVGGHYCFARRASVGVCNTPRRNVTHQGAARGGPVVLRPVRATPCSISCCTQRRHGVYLSSMLVPWRPAIRSVGGGYSGSVGMITSSLVKSYNKLVRTQEECLVMCAKFGCNRQCIFEDM